VSGSNVGFDLGSTGSGAAFLAEVLGAQFTADDSGSYALAGEGPLAGLGTFGHAGPGAPYHETDPDVLSPAGDGVTVLRYGSGTGAAVGRAGKAAMAGFPLELVDGDEARAAVVKALVQFAGG
jgi:hypothetical protein